MKKLPIILLTAIVFMLSSCALNGSVTDESEFSSGAASTPADSGNPPQSDIDDPGELPDEFFTAFDLRTESDGALPLDLSNPESNPAGVSREEGNVYIRSAGAYALTGALDGGTLIIEVSKEEKVHLLLCGVSITSADSAAVYIKSADKVTVTLARGTENHLSDGNYDPDAAGAPKACLYSKDDLTINGHGKLTVTGNTNNAISTKNDLKIIDADITVSSVNNGLKGNDSVSIRRAKIAVTSSEDGIKSDTADKAGKGFVYIESGDISITADDDAIQAELYIRIAGGKVTCRAGDLMTNCEKEVTVNPGSLVRG